MAPALQYANRNAEARIMKVQNILVATDFSADSSAALEHAIITDRSKIPQAAKDRLKLILSKYLET